MMITKLISIVNDDDNSQSNDSYRYRYRYYKYIIVSGIN